MDKLLCTLGMGLMISFVKMRTWLDSFTGMVKGEDGFMMVMTICLAALVVAGAALLVTSRKKKYYTH